ncbi:hypothetical protein [Pseudaquabacterium rugosum]|uniref:Uncharacterized protein n=1 Tax=Pseudaquabacterium rugosum TaxID=2984194 RepID=A0ABU9BBE7_9BURK
MTLTDTLTALMHQAEDLQQRGVIRDEGWPHWQSLRTSIEQARNLAADEAANGPAAALPPGAAEFGHLAEKVDRLAVMVADRLPMPAGS